MADARAGPPRRPCRGEHVAQRPRLSSGAASLGHEVRPSMAVRETRASWRRLLFFFICIAVGVAAIVALRR